MSSAVLRALSVFALASAATTHVAVARAEEKAPAVAPPAATPPAGSAVRRDPKGIQGVSPAWEAVSAGDAKFRARDYDGAIVAYRSALSKGDSAILHYRVAEAQKLKGDAKEAEVAYDTALRLAGNDATLKGKVLFCLAALSERAKDYDAALERWSAYETFAKAAEKAKLHPASGSERKKRVQEWKQLVKDSNEVKARIEKRLLQAEETSRKNATSK